MKFRLVERFEEENNEIMKLIKNNFQVTKDPAIGGYYILPSGEAIKVNRDHADIDKFLIKQNIIPKYEVSFSDGSKYMDNLNCIRIRARGGKDSWINPYVTLPKNRPTEEQFETLVNWLDKVIDRVVFVHTSPGSDFVMYRENPDEVIKKIKRYYSSGKLYESKIEEKIEITNYKTSFEDKEKEFKGYGNFAFIDRDENYITGRLDEELEENDLDKEFDKIANYYLKEINKFLDNYGFEANLVDYKFENDAAGMFVGEEQDNASIFPIALNKKSIIEYGYDLDYDVETTIAHEVGHGIFRYLNDIYDLDEYNEEDIVEDFARDYSDNILDNNELMGILNYFVKDELNENYKEEMSGEYDSEGNELTKEQAQFFKNSKVRDKQGRLLVCYHGTNNNFDTFSKNKIKTGTFGNGFYFTTSKRSALNYGKLVNAFYLNINNPLFIPCDYEDINEFSETKFNIHTNSTKETTDYIKRVGYDGVVTPMYYNDDNFDYYVVFDPNQIKSITNKEPTKSNNINEDLYKKFTEEEIMDIINKMSNDGYPITFGNLDSDLIIVAPNGEIIGLDLGYNAHIDFADEIEEYIKKKDKDFKSFRTNPLDYLEGIGFLTLNTGYTKYENECKIVIMEKPTEKQYRIIEEWLDNINREKVLVYCRPQVRYFDRDEMTAKDIVKAIKRYYVSGVLTRE